MNDCTTCVYYHNDRATDTPCTDCNAYAMWRSGSTLDGAWSDYDKSSVNTSGGFTPPIAKRPYQPPPDNTEPPKPDPINSPAHYIHGGIETIDIIRMALTDEEFRGYLKGNILKYRERAPYKGKQTEDYAKARKYYDWLMEGI